jgi:hypothetical protein
VHRNVPTGSKSQLYTGYSHSIADMNDDFTPDLILSTNVGNTLNFEVWIIAPPNRYSLWRSYPAPNASFIYGHSLFADFGKNQIYVRLS